MPRFSEDDYVDFLVTEAVILKSMNTNRKAARAQREEEIMARWKRGEIDTVTAERLRAQL